MSEQLMFGLFGLELRKLRKEQKLTQDELGDLIGKCKKPIVDFEKGRTIPSESEMYLMSKRLTGDGHYLSEYMKSLQDEHTKGGTV